MIFLKCRGETFFTPTFCCFFLFRRRLIFLNSRLFVVFSCLVRCRFLYTSDYLLFLLVSSGGIYFEFPTSYYFCLFSRVTNSSTPRLFLVFYHLVRHSNFLHTYYPYIFQKKSGSLSPMSPTSLTFSHFSLDMAKKSPRLIFAYCNLVGGISQIITFTGNFFNYNRNKLISISGISQIKETKPILSLILL